MSLSKATSKPNDKLYSAGTAKTPVFARNRSGEVWLFADPVFFVEYGGKSVMKVRNGKLPKVYLWEVDLRECKLARKHPEFEGVFVCFCPSKVNESKLRKDLLSLTWKKSEELPSGEVTSLLDASVLRQLVRVYLTSNPPTTAEDFNSQAELKAVSHWRWLKDGAEAELVPGPHHDRRLKDAADIVLPKWKKELNDQETKVQQPPSKKEKLDTEDESCSDNIISDLKQGIFFLTMYYGGKD